MSTDPQQYSMSNSREGLREFPRPRGPLIVRGSWDEGKSGLNLLRPPAKSAPLPRRKGVVGMLARIGPGT